MGEINKAPNDGLIIEDRFLAMLRFDMCSNIVSRGWEAALRLNVGCLGEDSIQNRY